MDECLWLLRRLASAVPDPWVLMYFRFTPGDDTSSLSGIGRSLFSVSSSSQWDIASVVLGGNASLLVFDGIVDVELQKAEEMSSEKDCEAKQNRKCSMPTVLEWQMCGRDKREH